MARAIKDDKIGSCASGEKPGRWLNAPVPTIRIQQKGDVLNSELTLIMLNLSPKPKDLCMVHV